MRKKTKKPKYSHNKYLTIATALPSILSSHFSSIFPFFFFLFISLFFFGLVCRFFLMIGRCESECMQETNLHLYQWRNSFTVCEKRMPNHSIELWNLFLTHWRNWMKGRLSEFKRTYLLNRFSKIQIECPLLSFKMHKGYMKENWFWQVRERICSTELYFFDIQPYFHAKHFLLENLLGCSKFEDTPVSDPVSGH